MPSPAPEASPLIRLTETGARRERDFVLVPDEAALEALGAELGLLGLRKVRLTGRVLPEGRRDWRLEAHLGATVIQPCIVTLAPVTTRIETPIARHYLADYADPDEDEAEMPEDDTIEPLPEVLDVSQLLAEELALALPLYPRAEGAELGEAMFTEPGMAPMSDADARPFAGLKALKDKLGDAD